jgi:hypothetical protein
MMGRYALLGLLLVAACASDAPPEARPKTYAISDRTLGYSYAGGTIKPIPNTPTGMVRDGWNNSEPR